MTSASLFLCHRLPFPPNKGDKIRSFALLKHLAALGPVHLACFIDDPQDLKYRDEARAIAGGKCMLVPIGRATKWWRAANALLSGQPITTAYFASRKIEKWVKDILENQTIDNVIVFGSAMAPYLLEDKTRAASVLFDMVDVDSKKWRQYAQSSAGLSRWIYDREARAIANLETKAARAFGKTLLVSPHETETFRQMVPECAAKIDTLSNGVDLGVFSPGDFASPFSQDELAIVMTGHMDYRPNCDGALWFAKQVAPRLFLSLPTAHVYFVGANPPSALRQINGPKITVTGAVADVRPYMQGAAAIIAPLLIARGVQNKVLEAMAMKKSIVATRQATLALAVRSGVHLWIENDPQRFADAIVAAIRSPERQRIRDNARTYVEKNHNWEKILSGLDQTLERMAHEQVSSNQRTTCISCSEMGAHQPDIAGVEA